MDDDITKAKKALRIEMRNERSTLNVDIKELGDASICKQLLDIIAERDIKAVHSYLPMGSEVDVLPVIKGLLKMGLKVVCPKTLPKRKLENRVLISLSDLEEGPMKTFHPKQSNIYTGNYDLIIVPGLAFDSNNFRVGYGGGYYDGFLAENKEALTVGVFYEFQKVDNVPRESHDLALDMIFTPSK